VAHGQRAGAHCVFHSGCRPSSSPPTVAGNRPDDAKTVGLDDAIKSIVDYVADNEPIDVILLGHGYGGMFITGVADRVPARVHCLVYWNAFVPDTARASMTWRHTSDCLVRFSPNAAMGRSCYRLQSGARLSSTTSILRRLRKQMVGSGGRSRWLRVLEVMPIDRGFGPGDCGPDDFKKEGRCSDERKYVAQR
jgi:pimeloyl-ACP methyl ester carboxylesterase